MKYATYIALISTVSSVQVSRSHRIRPTDDEDITIPGRMGKPAAMAQVKTEARAKKDAMIMDKVRTYLAQNGERLEQKQ